MLLVGVYTAAMHAPAPHEMKVAVAGPPAQTAPLAASLQKAVGAAYDTLKARRSTGRKETADDRAPLPLQAVPSTSR
ncbi:hypothetical protein [Streptomyces sioyaensis]|uniref:hypothetical protein n=1 Tax=Streptomyces sioyaensis TaxID=67364 RepID=UPI0036DFFE0E